MQEEALPDAEHRPSEMLCGLWPLAGRDVQVLCKHRSKNAEQRVQWHSAATIQGERKAALQLRVEACAMTKD